MAQQDRFMHTFDESVEHIALPASFTYPFYYDPHPLAEIAAKQLQSYLENQNDFEHNFGFDSNFKDGIGKMFGVLVVTNKNGDLGYLAAFSGKLADSNEHSFFVPPIFDILTDDGFFLKEEEIINQINSELESLLNSHEYRKLKKQLEDQQDLLDNGLKKRKEKYKQNKQKRDHLRKAQQLTVEQLDELKRQSIADSYELKKWKKSANQSIDQAANNLEEFEKKITDLKTLRKNKSNQLQRKIFQHYELLNAKNEHKDIVEVFTAFNGEMPPAGSGECAAPKLLNYAYQNNLKPLCMAEFWWGRPPLSEVRKHGAFYPACRSKCEPILGFMLKGLNVDANPIAQNYGKDKVIEIVYEDEDLLVVNKPEGLLSVPGKIIHDSVYSRLLEKYSSTPDLLLVHRLDMSTSGLIVVTKNRRAHKFVQRQFIKRQIKKKYVAILDGTINKKKGVINLPMRVDLNNRPRQLICYEYGKKAITSYEVLDVCDQKTRIVFYPKTGRTHQLRLHAAHKLGLDTPLLGDDLYGTKKDRLYLHAAEISFTHPSTKQTVCFSAPADF